MNKNLLTLAIAMILSQPSFADDESKVELDSTTVVAVANKQARPIMEVVGSVSVINADDIRSTNSENIADVLRYESNINMENAGTRFGSSGINIRGIGQNRVAIEIDGITNAKQFSLGSYSNATALFPDTDLIKSIEILNGPASTLYGSDAIGGIVSIQTWNPEDLTGFTDDNHYNKIRIGYDGKTHGRVITGLTAWDNKKLGGVVSFTQRDGKGLINHNSTRLSRDFSDWDEQTLFSKFVMNTSESNSLKFGFTGTKKNNDTQINSFIGQGRFSRTTELLAQDKNDNIKFYLDYDFNIENNLFDDGIIRSYFSESKFEQNTHEKRNSRHGTPLAQYRYFQFSQKNLGVELNLNKQYVTHNSTHNIVYGVDLKSASIDESRNGSETNLSTGITKPSILGEVFPRRDFPNSKVNEFGVFMLDEIKLENSAWTVIPAIRYDYYNLQPSRDALFDANGVDTDIVSINTTDISPKLGLMYAFNQQSNVYIQYVRGFRAPPFDDVNIGLNLPIFNIRAIANPNLKSETSNGFEVGYRYFGETQQFNFTAFYTDYNNFIETKARIGIDPTSGTLLFQSRNIDEAEIYGLEMTHQWQFTDTLSSYTTLAWTRGNNKTNDQPLNTISPAKLIHNLSWHSVNKKWNLDLYSTFNAAQNHIDESSPRDNFFKPAGFLVFDIFVGYEITQKQKVRLGLFNMTDKKYWDWQQVRNFDANDAIINALSKPSRSISMSYSIEL